MSLNKFLAVAGTLLVWTVPAPTAVAQGTQTGGVAAPRPPGREVSGALKRAGGFLEQVFTAPIHPLVKGVASGGGVGAGIGADFGRGPWEVGGDAVITARRYTSLSGFAGYDSRRLQVEGYWRKRDMRQLNYFGIGNASSEDNRTDYRLEDEVYGARAMAGVLSWLTVSGRAEVLDPVISTGKSPRFPSVEEVFDEGDAPGLALQPEFTRYEGWLEIRLPAASGEGFLQGARYRATYSRVDDQDLDQFSFDRIDVEVQHRFAMFAPFHRLTLHGLASMSEPDEGNVVPFYLQRTLGGKGYVRSFHEDIIGGDGTAATLRGYRSFRFRDYNTLLLQAEYRLPLWGPVDATVFYDAGKVARDRADLDLSGLHSNYGFSLSLMRGPFTALRSDFAFGGEGFRILLSIGKDIVP
jgi:hypothetical protein